MRIGAFAILTSAAALSACTSRPQAIPVEPVAVERTEWRKDDQLDETWHARAPNGLRASVALRREDGRDVVHVMTGAGESAHWPDAPADEPREQRVAIEVAGIPAGTAIGTTTYSLGWHLVEQDAEVRAGEPLLLQAAYQRHFRLDAERVFGARRLSAGVFRLDVVATDGGEPRRMPVAFRFGERSGGE